MLVKGLSLPCFVFALDESAGSVIKGSFDSIATVNETKTFNFARGDEG
jgi:hypothetical protein